MNETDHILDIKHRISKWWSRMDNDNLSLEEEQQCVKLLDIANATDNNSTNTENQLNSSSKSSSTEPKKHDASAHITMKRPRSKSRLVSSKNLFQLNELTDGMMNLCNNDLYNFLENSLNKDLCELFRVQAIRHMTSLSSITIDQIIEILTLDTGDLNNLKKSLGFVTSDEKFHLRLDHRNLLERLLLLVKSKTNSSIKNSDLSNQ
ncbi:unnamed protein product [Rotaria socialis]|uniref:Uncharacterized protein n=1 Tax=Rotaria socialis TaxID=392032 RepID=A0A821UB91_9BILA|nr:unnamed protein product [Rotaria socialis]